MKHCPLVKVTCRRCNATIYSVSDTPGQMCGPCWKLPIYAEIVAALRDVRSTQWNSNLRRGIAAG